MLTSANFVADPAKLPSFLIKPVKRFDYIIKPDKLSKISAIKAVLKQYK